MKFLRWTMSQAGAFGSGGGGGGAGTITGNDGTPEAQVANNWNIVTANSTLKFAGTAGTETIDMNGDSNNNIIMSNTLQTVSPGNNNVIIGSGSGGADGANNVSIGSGAGPALNLGSSANIAIGNGALASSSGNSCVAVGIAALQRASTDTGCIAIGSSSLSSLNGSSVGNNVAIGNGCAGNLTSGNYSIFLGYSAGGFYETNESNNITLNSLGVTGESNVLRICDAANTSTGTALSKAFIGGINGVNVSSSTTRVVTMTSGSDQLGTATLTEGSGITITPTANTITISASTFSPTNTDTTGIGWSGSTQVFGGDGVGNLSVGSSFSVASGNGQNIGFGVGSPNMYSNITTGYSNVGVGGGNPAPLVSLTTGANNLAFGNSTLCNITSDSNNVAVGANSLAGLGYSGYGGPSNGNNTCVGYQSGNALGPGSYNTILGAQNPNVAGAVSGNYSTLLGYFAGQNYSSSESNNILINSLGVNAESNVLRICDAANTSTGTGLSAAYIGGITGVSVTGAAVIVAANDQLGVTVSSRKYKDNIQDMGDASNKLYNLRPTTFNYKGSTETNYGLIAEEVAEVMPNLVVYDKSGDPQTVMYHELPALLLNEIQKLRKDVDALKGK